MQKICRSCYIEKDSVCFNKQVRNKDGLQSYCKECNRKRGNTFYALHAKEENERNLIWRLQNKEKEKSRKQQWEKHNRSQRLYLQAKRRASIKQATPAWADGAVILDMYKEADYMQLQVDHIVPLKSTLVCGLHTPENLQLLTKEANCHKGNRYWPDMPEKTK